MCGYPKPDHKDEAIKPEDYTGQQYDKHRHIREVPTDAFGDINFGGIGQKTGRVNGNWISLGKYAYLLILFTKDTLEFDI